MCEAKLSSPTESSANAPSDDVNEGHVGDTTKCRDADVVTDTAEVDQLTTTLDALATGSIEESIPVSSVDDVSAVTLPAGVTYELATRQMLIPEPESEAKQSTFAQILKQYRKFSIDLMPKVRLMLCSSFCISIFTSALFFRYSSSVVNFLVLPCVGCTFYFRVILNLIALSSLLSHVMRRIHVVFIHCCMSCICLLCCRDVVSIWAFKNCKMH